MQTDTPIPISDFSLALSLVGGAPTSRTDSPRRDSIRAALDDSTCADPAAISAAAFLRNLRGRPIRAADVAGFAEALGSIPNGEDFLGILDHAFAVGAPVPVDGAKDDRVSGTGGDIDIDDLFADCPAVRDMMRYVRGLVLCSPDLPVLTSLAIISTAVACKAVGVADGGGWRQPPNLFIAAEVASGDDKTRVRKECGGKILQSHGSSVDGGGTVAEWHAQVFDKIELERMEAQHQIKALTAKAAREGVASERAKAFADIRKQSKTANKPTPRIPQWLQQGTVTPQGFALHMASGGFVAIFPDEGKDMLDGFIGDGKRMNLAPLLTAYSGEQYDNATKTGAITGEQTRFSETHGTMFLPLQLGILTPSTVEQARELAMLGQRGFLARFLIARPRGLTVRDADAAEEAFELEFGDAPGRPRRHPGTEAEEHAKHAHAERVRAAYAGLLTRLLTADGPVAGDTDGTAGRREEERLVGRPHPLVPARAWEFVFEPAADAALLGYQRANKRATLIGQKYNEALRGSFVRRLADNLIRLATLLAILRKGEITGGGTVTLADVQRAIRVLGRTDEDPGYFIRHALGVYDRAVLSPVDDDGAVVWERLAPIGEITKRDLMARMPNNGRDWGKAKGGDKMSRLEAALEHLEARGRITQIKLPRGSILVRVTPE